MPKKILIFVTNPTNIVGIRSNTELEEIKNIFKGSANFSIECELVTTFEKFCDDLFFYEPNIVHFIGHGKKNSLIFENGNGRKDLRTTEELVDILKKYSQNIECLFLSACYSIIPATTISKYINCTIGMQDKIKDSDAIEFTKRFYQALEKISIFDYCKAFEYAHNKVFKGINYSKLIPQIIPKPEYAENSQQVANKISPYLLIDLEPNNNKYKVQAWLFISSKNSENIYEKNEATKLNEIPKLLEEILDIIDNWQINHNQLTIEFILPDNLLYHNVEHWEDGNGEPIGINYRVVLFGGFPLRFYPPYICIYIFLLV